MMHGNAKPQNSSSEHGATIHTVRKCCYLSKDLRRSRKVERTLLFARRIKRFNRNRFVSNLF